MQKTNGAAKKNTHMLVADAHHVKSAQIYGQRLQPKQLTWSNFSQIVLVQPLGTLAKIGAGTYRSQVLAFDINNEPRDLAFIEKVQ